MSDENGKTDYKFVVLLSKKIGTGVALNVASHMVAALMAKATEEDKEMMKFLEYVDGSEKVHLVSGLSLIVLRADNSNKIRQARNRAIDEGILNVDFTESMTGGTYVEQIKLTQATPESELIYYGLCMFGLKEKIDLLTSKFSLYH